MGVLLGLENICKTYKHSVLSGCNYKFNKTGLYAIYGVSGSGKSTLLNMIAGFETPDSGQIISNVSALEYVMQEHMLLNNITIRENLYVKLNVTKHKVSEYDNLIFEICKKLNIEKLIDEKVSVLSGGEKQRVSIARALLNVPEVILLDEPTSSIDHGLKSNLLELLQNLSKHMLIIATTHDPLLTNYVDVTLFLERGNLRE